MRSVHITSYTISKLRINPDPERDVVARQQTEALKTDITKIRDSLLDDLKPFWETFLKTLTPYDGEALSETRIRLSPVLESHISSLKVIVKRLSVIGAELLDRKAITPEYKAVFK
jgi:hypothetical protein